ncbi:MAG: hypothetical protein MUE59_09860 [Thiobacillaceae bacterium]|jgi:hypothetical protein|nr:hypothetical protein [Thiobacillaceae bacterium]
MPFRYPCCTLLDYEPEARGACPDCGQVLPGRFGARPAAGLGRARRPRRVMLD